MKKESVVLEKCPFCGGKASPFGRKKKKIVCDECGASTGTYYLLSDAVKAWEERVEK